MITRFADIMMKACLRLPALHPGILWSNMGSGIGKSAMMQCCLGSDLSLITRCSNSGHHVVFSAIQIKD